MRAPWIQSPAKAPLMQGFGARDSYGEPSIAVSCITLLVACQTILKFTITNMAAREDVDMIDATTKVQDPHDYADLLQTNHSDAFAFSENEQLALELYDKLIEMELEQSLLVAQQSGMRACSVHSLKILIWCSTCDGSVVPFG
jgi:hypothetical protein